MHFPLFKMIGISILLYGMAALIHAEDDSSTDNRSLYIESKTGVASAQCIIDGENEDDDKKRTDVGIGEEVELTLTGKRFKEVDPASIEWILEPDNLADIKKSDKEENQATLKIHKDITQDTTLNVRVKTSLDEELPEREPSVFHILVPSEIKAEHTGERIESCAQDGEKDNPGASSILDLTLHPLSVSFSNIAFIERAKDPEGFKPSHDPGHLLFRPNARNKAIPSDHIGWKFKDGIRLRQLQQSNLPAPFSWACGWYTRVDDKDCLLIHGDTYPQNFQFEYDGEETDEDSPTKGLNNVKVTVSKFGCTVTRSTAGKATHQNS